MPSHGRKLNTALFPPTEAALDYLTGRRESSAQIDIVNDAIRLLAELRAVQDTGVRVQLVYPDGRTETLRFI